MKIEHIAIYVKELEKARDFLSTILRRVRMKDITMQRRDFAPIS